MKRRNIASGPAAGVPALVLVALVASGCATAPLARSRAAFREGNYTNAAAALTPITAGNIDRVLCLLERGMAQQCATNYEASLTDWFAALAQMEQLDAIRISKDTAGVVVNERSLPYRAAPFESVLLHAFAAKSYLAMDRWEDAAVEARNIIHLTESRGDVPADPYSRYLAGFCLEMTGDRDGAQFLYRQLTNSFADAVLDPDTGRFQAPAATNAEPDEAGPAPAAAAATATPAAELVCFIGCGDFLSLPGPAGYAEIYDGDQRLGRSYPLTDVATLREKTREQRTGRVVARTVVRLALKEILIAVVRAKDDDLGDLLRVALYELEVADDREWASLPRALHVARVPCRPDLTAYRIVFRDGAGRACGSLDVEQPLARRHNTRVSFCRSGRARAGAIAAAPAADRYTPVLHGELGNVTEASTHNAAGGDPRPDGQSTTNTTPRTGEEGGTP